VRTWCSASPVFSLAQPAPAPQSAEHTAVPVLVDAIKAVQGLPHFTIYSEAKHDAWTQAYAGDELYTWLPAQNRRQRSAPTSAP
jgi:hypothetical protein